MNILKSVTYITLSVSLLFGASQQENKQLQNIVRTGQKSSMLLLKTLGSNMKRNMKAGGPMQALDFCTQKAYTLTEEVNKKLPKGVTVKRISTKYRNPANQPQGNEQEVLASLEKLQSLHVKLPKQLIQKVDEHTYKYYKPLVINKQVCLKCHGNIQNEALKRAIAQRYPEDKAQHYKMGDLRGAVVVTIKK
ncbi:Tll0287-like domain-containing protein [Sulfurimonas sp. NW15]|uniref:Tll0287-like domain-containing protein n=1 Tax=unclassified Sulfurimonas TaxID=2623549 RepID=UPI003DA871BB